VSILGSWLSIAWLVPNLTPTQKQQLAKELVSGVMVELGYTQAVDVKLVAEAML
jgi:hypothetical protein